MHNDIEVFSFRDAAEWESWLAQHHQLPAGAWLKIGKKGSGAALLMIEDALDVALCYGWIDSHRKSGNESYFLQRYSRRRPKSPWSKINTDKAAELIAAGRMQAPGHAEIAAAKADGRWSRHQPGPEVLARN